MKSLVILATGTVLWGQTISVSPTSINSGSTVTVTVSGSQTSNIFGWVGRYPQNNVTIGTYQDWQYLNGSSSPPSSPLINATLQFPIPAGIVGNFQFVLHGSDNFNPVATSNVLNVSNSIVTITAGTAICLLSQVQVSCNAPSGSTLLATYSNPIVAPGIIGTFTAGNSIITWSFKPSTVQPGKVNWMASSVAPGQPESNTSGTF